MDLENEENDFMENEDITQNTTGFLSKQKGKSGG